MIGRWVELFAALGRGILQLFAAEAEDLFADLAGSGRALVQALLYLVVAIAVVFWTVGVLAFAAIAGLAEAGQWPYWVAALVVAAAMVLVAAALGGAGWWRIRQIEGPGRTIRRHVEDHVNWWEQLIEEESGQDPSG